MVNQFLRKMIALNLAFIYILNKIDDNSPPCFAPLETSNH